MPLTTKDYILENILFQDLSIIQLLKHYDKDSSLMKVDLHEVAVLHLTLHEGLFTRDLSGIRYPHISVQQIAKGILVSCSCAGTEKKLCDHALGVLWAIIENKAYRLFFDDSLRQDTLRQQAQPYGLENEKNLDYYFGIQFLNGRVQIDLLQKDILALDIASLKAQLLPAASTKIEALNLQQHSKHSILVLHTARFHKNLQFTLMHAHKSKAGKLKNPLEVIPLPPLLWQTTNQEALKFYAALLAMNTINEDDIASQEQQILAEIIQNPLRLAVYLHNEDYAVNMHSKSLSPIELKAMQAEITIRINRSNNLYTFSGTLHFADISLPFSELQLNNRYFILYQQTLIWLSNPALMPVIKYFKKYNDSITVHASKFQVFQEQILNPLAQYVHIDHQYLTNADATKAHATDFLLERILYFNQDDQYITINPFIKYGSKEISLFSRQQLHMPNADGDLQKWPRNVAAESAFMALIVNQHPAFKGQMEDQDFFHLPVSEFLDENWFLDSFEQWRAAGVSLFGFNKLKNNKLNAHKGKIDIQILSGTDWFDAKITVKFGDQDLALKKVHAAFRKKSKYVSLADGTQGLLPEAWLQLIAPYFQLGELISNTVRIPKINFDAIQEIAEPNTLSKAFQEEATRYKVAIAKLKNKDIAIPPIGLQATLRSYQLQGLAWLQKLDALNMGGCLADDMGLGKTIQVIAFLLQQKQEHPTAINLIVVPTSLLFNWQDEITKFAPSLRVLPFNGSDRPSDISTFKDYDILLSSYGIMVRDIGILKKQNFNYIILDESQAIKNSNSERHLAAQQLVARNKLLLTGTPLENNTFDVYGQLSWACPGLLGNKLYFKNTYAIPIDRFQEKKRALTLQQKIQPFILRRSKQEVAQELPEKTEMVLYCDMGPDQRLIYESHVQELKDYIQEQEDEDFDKSSMHVLAGLTRLRQICNAPYLLKTGYDKAYSSKISMLMKQIELLNPKHKILVFSQFVGMLELIQEQLEEKSISYELLTGGTTNRKAKVDRFQQQAEVRVFLISLKAGGTGLNLTEADYVFLVDPWWNPAVENQAIDRCYRIGQTKQVMAIRLICSNSIEEKIRKIQEKKNQLALDLLHVEDKSVKKLGKKGLIELLS